MSTIELFRSKLEVARLGNWIIGEGTAADMIGVQKLSRRVNWRAFSKPMLNRKWSLDIARAVRGLLSEGALKDR